MPENVNNYEAVIADLKAKRDAIDRAILTLQQLAGFSESVASSDAIQYLAASGATGAVSDDSFFGLSIPQAIRKFLGIAKKKQTAAEIVKALERGGLQHASKNLYSTVSTVIRRMEARGDVVKVGSEWGLLEWYPSLKGRIKQTAARTEAHEVNSTSAKNAVDASKAEEQQRDE